MAGWRRYRALRYDEAMKNVQRHSAAITIFLSLCAAPAAVSAFEAIDTIPWPSRGVFPAYPREDDRATDYWVQGGVIRDDNVLRLESGEQSDTVTRVGAGIRHEARIVGRQRLRLLARGDYYAYDRFSDLDHFAYALGADWLWEIGNNLSGTVAFGRERRQIDLGETLAERLDIATSTRFGATAAYAVSPRFRVRGGLAATRSERETIRATETRATSAIAGADYVSPLGNTLGVEFRTTQGEAPFDEFVPETGSFVSNDYDEQEISFVATYALGAQLRSGIRLGHTARDYDEIAARDFDGPTGRIFVDWLPGNKTILGFEAYREPRSVVDIGASHVLLKGLAFGPRWAVTNKVVVSARFVRERREFEGDPGLVAGRVLRNEVLSLVRFALGWEPQRRWQLSAALDRGERESNIPGRDYNYAALMGNLAYVW
jgi:hypothetical protein